MKIKSFGILSGFFLLISLVLILQCNDVALDLNYQNPCFEKDIVPLVKRDCSRCHENGEYRFKISGTGRDYETIISYCDTTQPENSLFLKYATGKGTGKKHPKIWEEGSKEYITFYNWVAQGAKDVCIDQSLGECQDDSDCQEITCVCPDLSVLTVTKCYIDENGSGTCVNDNNCSEDRFGICAGNDAGSIDIYSEDVRQVSDIETIDSVSDASVVDTGFDSGTKDVGSDVIIIDAGFDTGIKDTGYDADIRDIGTTDTGYDSGYDAGQDTGISTVSFSKQIVPLIKTDCRSCHYAGQHGIKLTGTVSDYSEVMRYVDIQDPEGAYGFLWWAAGGGGHPNKWPRGGTKYNLFLKWVNEGAKNI